MRWRALSVHTKLTLVTTAACVAVLVLAGGGIISVELARAEGEVEHQLTSVANLVAAANTATVRFRDADAAAEALSALRVYEGIEAARIDPADDLMLASFGAAEAFPPEAQDGATVTSGGSLIVSRPIVLDAEVIGTVRVRGTLSAVHARVRRYASIVGVVITLSAFVAYLLSSMLHRTISGPLGRLAHMARRISQDSDYRTRATKENDDEVGVLVEQFNDMLAQIERRDTQLLDAHSQLEARVLERTASLEQEIGERRRTENELILSKAAAESANAAKSAFLANMSHELRTPLNAIIGYSELLAEEAEGPRQESVRKDLGHIASAGKHLLALISDVLDLSKIEAGRLDIECVPTDVASVVRTVVATSEVLASTRENQLHVDGLDTAGHMRTDPTRLRQVLLNIVGNACKFTSGGDVWVRVSRPVVAGHVWVYIDVTDTGIGIAPEQLGRLFKEFTQADVSTTRRFGGTGLGLAISQRLCGLMGGCIDVTSTPGTGSTFTIKLPADGPGASAAEERAA